MDSMETLSLAVRRRFEAPAERAFDAWLDGEGVGRWLFATPDGRMERVELDPRVGGTFTIVERRGEDLADHSGTYLEIERPRRLVFAFSMGAGEPTRVSVEIEALAGGRCEVALTHELGPRWASYRERAIEGWTMILEGLAGVVEQ